MNHPDDRSLANPLLSAHIFIITTKIVRLLLQGTLADWAPESNDTTTRIFRQTYEDGGLTAVDNLIKSVNENLRRRHVAFGFRGGAATVGDEGGRAEYLIVPTANLVSGDHIGYHHFSLS